MRLLTIEEQLKSIIKTRYKSVRAFTNQIGIPYTTLDSVFKRGISNSGIGTMLKIFESLDLDVESIPTGTLIKKSPAPAEADTGDKRLNGIIENYHQLNEAGQQELVDYAEGLTYMPKYKKCDSISEEETEVG